MKASVIVVALLALGGCATEVIKWVFSGPPPAEFVGPNGQKGYLLTCNGSMVNCYNDARAVCQGDYEVLNQSQRQNYKPANSITGTDASVSTTRTMEVLCAAPAK